ncbi:small membrane A-kinase anchor protein-like [Seriola lalandi dorsalis]|uniref:Small membrane A-kinase anchor protein-like n=1 Tax=Seriola lalandi dorsalis TaxID=1841481 RepID=A0A3B4YSG3_SERLL|nr:small membrane A-kinase anchor protein-like [Seriola lalandi dorsalis]XP_056227070.1 small membrane A-kinase anchor protein-like [Seriola aureovittata]
MGCNESRCWSRSCPDKQKEAVIGKQGEERKAFLEDVKETERLVGPEETAADVCSLDLPPVGKQILDLAQKMSEDIVAQALQLCWEVEVRYKDLPFIDNECDYVI